MEWLNYHHLRYFWIAAREGSVSRAAKVLRVTQPTVSEQIHALEDALGEKLLQRDGRSLGLTEVGRAVMRYADEIFSLGSELLDTVKGRPTGKPLRLAVGVADAVPKAVAFRILEPALAMSDRVRIECCEDTPGRLVAALAAHALDLVIADAPAPAGPVEMDAVDALGGAARIATRVYSHLLGECGVSVFASPRRAAEMRVGFPRSLDGAPFLLPAPNNALRRELDAWFAERGIAPNVVGEFQDAALLASFAEAGVGLFAAPDAIAPKGRATTAVRVGSLAPLEARYYAITAERRIVHPAVAAIAGSARQKLFARAKRR